MDKFLDVFDLPKLNQEDINHLNRSIISNEVEVVIKSFLTKKRSGLDRFPAKFYQSFTEELTLIRSNYLMK
jgi:hypothetical protein